MFIDTLLVSYREYVQRRQVSYDRKIGTSSLLAQLTDQGTKRILFDSRQAMVFADMDEHMMPGMQARLHVPFDRFYIEFTDPIEIGEQEPNTEVRDRIRGILYRSNAIRMQLDEKETDSWMAGVHDWANVIVFLDNSAGEIVDRGFNFNIETGLAATALEHVLTTADPSVFKNVESVSKSALVVVGGEDSEEHHIGWWERTVDDYATLTSWLIAYMMAKGVSITEQKVSRQQRRLAERNHTPLPIPWHKVEVKTERGTDWQGTTSGREHRFRYDVRGHLRIGRHRLKDGSHREVIEWVPPHQRGLRHNLYIPSLYHVKKGGVIDAGAKRYLGVHAEEMEKEQ